MVFDLYIVILILSSLVGVIYFGKLHSALKVLVVLLVYTALHELVMHERWLSQTTEAYWVYTGLSSAMYLEFMRRSIMNRYFKFMFLVLTVAFSVLGFSLAFPMKHVFPSQFIMAAIPFMVLGCIIVLFLLLRNVTEQAILSNPIFISASAILIYQCVFFTYFGSLNFLMDNDQLTDSLRIAFKISSVLYYGTLGYAFLLSRQNWTNLNAS